MVRILLLRPNSYKSIRFHINFRSAYFPCPNRQVQIKYTCCTDEEGNHWKEKTRGMGRTTFPTATVIMVSMRRHILSRANVVALERQLEISQSPFALRFYSHSV